MVFYELSDKIKYRLNKMGLAARKLKLGDFLDSLGGFAKITVDYEEDHDPVELLEEDLPANPIVFIGVGNSDAAAVLIVPTGVLKLYVVQNTSSNVLSFTPKSGIAYDVAAGEVAILVESSPRRFTRLGDTVTASSVVTFTNKTLTAPTINGGTITGSVIREAKHEKSSFVTHNFEAEALTWEMTAAEAQNDVIIIGAAPEGSTIVLPDTVYDTKQFTVINTASSNPVTIKGAIEPEATGVAIDGGKSAIIFEIQNHVYRITADA